MSDLQFETARIRKPGAATLVLALGVAAGACLTAGALPARADDAHTVAITLKDGGFEPAEIKVPANKALVITIKNASSAAAEFESKPLKIEKVIAASGEGVVRVRPLKPGRYAFVNEYKEDTVKGTIVVE